MATEKTTTLSGGEDVTDLLTAKASHLHAMLMQTCTDAGDSFRGMSDELQDDYLCACLAMASDIKQLAGLLHISGIVVGQVATEREVSRA